MLTFNNDESIKKSYINMAISQRKSGYTKVLLYEKLLIPRWLHNLENEIFKNLPKIQAIDWPERFIEAIPVGVDIEAENIYNKISIKRLDRLIKLQKSKLDKYSQKMNDLFLNNISIIEMIKKCHEAEINKIGCDWNTANSSSVSAARNSFVPDDPDDVEFLDYTCAYSSVASAAQCCWSSHRNEDSAVWSARMYADSIAASSAAANSNRSSASINLIK